MSNLMPREEIPPGLDRGDFVPLGVMEFRRAYVLFQDGLDGLLPKDPDRPVVGSALSLVAACSQSPADPSFTPYQLPLRRKRERAQEGTCYMAVLSSQ
jgi:hypothetical protein